MTIDRHTLLFLDAACLIAAAGSPSGGSGFLLLLVGRVFLRAVVSQAVLAEAERNVASKLPAIALARLQRFLLDVPLALVPVPLLGQRATYQQVVGVKDDHVVASAIAAGAPFLVTLDRPLIDAGNSAGWPLEAVTPGDFITCYLPSHPDFPARRSRRVMMEATSS